MSNVNVTVYANEVEGPFSDDTARLRVVGDFMLPNVGSSVLTLEYVIGQVNNETSAKFVGPVREAIATLRGDDGADLRVGDVIRLDGAYHCTHWSVAASDRVQEEWGGEVDSSVVS